MEWEKVNSKSTRISNTKVHLIMAAYEERPTMTGWWRSALQIPGSDEREDLLEQKTVATQCGSRE